MFLCKHIRYTNATQTIFLLSLHRQDEIIGKGTMSTYIQQLEEYFNNTTSEQQDKDYRELQEFNQNGITVDDYIQSLGLSL